MKNYKEIENTLYGKTLSIKVKRTNGITTRKQRKITYIVYYSDTKTFGLYKVRKNSFANSKCTIPKSVDEIVTLTLKDTLTLVNGGEVTIVGKTKLNIKYTITYKIIGGYNLCVK